MSYFFLLSLVCFNSSEFQKRGTFDGSDLVFQDSLCLYDRVDIVSEIGGVGGLFGGVLPEFVGYLSVELCDSGVTVADRVEGLVDFVLGQLTVLDVVQPGELGQDFIIV